jgi:four helix bundle protein
MEAVCQLKMATRLGYIEKEQLDTLESGAEELAKMLSGLKASRE